MKNFIGKLVLPVYVLAIGFLSWTAVGSHINARAIMKDHTVASATMELVDVSSRTRRGHTSTSYDFEYTYDVAGQIYTGTYGAVNEKGERYIDDPVIEIAYSNREPARAGALHVLERQLGLMSVLFRILIAALILGVIALGIYGWTMPDDDDEEEGATATDGQVPAS